MRSEALDVHLWVLFRQAEPWIQGCGLMPLMCSSVYCFSKQYPGLQMQSEALDVQLWVPLLQAEP